MEIPTSSKQFLELVDNVVQECGFEKFLAVAGIKEVPHYVHYMLYSGDAEARKAAVEWIANAAARCPSVSKLVYSLAQRAIVPANINVSLQGGGGGLLAASTGATSVEKQDYEGVKGRLPAK